MNVDNYLPTCPAILQVSTGVGTWKWAPKRYRLHQTMLQCRSPTALVTFPCYFTLPLHRCSRHSYCSSYTANHPHSLNLVSIFSQNLKNFLETAGLINVSLLTDSYSKEFSQTEVLSFSAPHLLQ